MLRAIVVFCVLTSLKLVARCVYRFESKWVGDVPETGRWDDVRIGVLLNHTSLFEPLFAAMLPSSLIWRLARGGAVPIADVTMKRPLAGLFFGLLAAQVVTISRKRDASWQAVIDAIRPDSMVLIMPEGRMMRRGGLDKNGHPMTVRGGVADLIRATDGGRMLIGYSGGLHHIQAPGEGWPRIFRRIRMTFETIDVVAYRDALLAESGEKGFKRAIVHDLQSRRNEHAPSTEETGRAIPVAEHRGHAAR